MEITDTPESRRPLFAEGRASAYYQQWAKPARSDRGDARHPAATHTLRCLANGGGCRPGEAC